MQIKHEIRYYGKNEKVWVGKYRNSQNLSHWHYDCELIFAERGSFEIMCEKKLYLLNKGGTFFIDSGQLHYIRAQSADAILVTVFFTNDVKKPFSDGKILADPLLSRDYGIQGLYSSLKRTLLEKPKLYQAESALQVAEYMIQVFRGEQTQPQTKPKQTTEKFKTLLEMMSENYEFFTFESAADFMGMNQAYFSRFFHKMSGVPFSHYLNCIRVEKAVNLLHSSEKSQVTDIAISCGFSTIRNFNRVFKDITGYSPKNLPPDYVLDEAFSNAKSACGNPTLNECELIECSSSAPETF